MENQKENLFNDLHTINRQMKVQMQQHFKEMGLAKIGHPYILKELNRPENNGQMDTQKDFAAKLNISTSAIAQSIKLMEHEGLIRKISDESDLRVNQIMITDKGRKFVTKLDEGFQQVNKKLFAGFSEEEKSQLHHYFLRIIENLEKQEKE
jgi:DNA-binding MarR family transcriptional regulator